VGGRRRPLWERRARRELYRKSNAGLKILQTSVLIRINHRVRVGCEKSRSVAGDLCIVHKGAGQARGQNLIIEAQSPSSGSSCLSLSAQLYSSAFAGHFT